MEAEIDALKRGESVVFGFCGETDDEAMQVSFLILGALINQPIRYRKLITAHGVKAIAWIDGVGSDPLDLMLLKETDYGHQA